MFKRCANEDEEDSIEKAKTFRCPSEKFNEESIWSTLNNSELNLKE